MLLWPTTTTTTMIIIDFSLFFLLNLVQLSSCDLGVLLRRPLQAVSTTTTVVNLQNSLSTTESSSNSTGIIVGVVVGVIGVGLLIGGAFLLWYCLKNRQGSGIYKPEKREQEPKNANVGMANMLTRPNPERLI